MHVKRSRYIYIYIYIYSISSHARSLASVYLLNYASISTPLGFPPRVP
jgi:hypothetical protein